jgi:hypothetical protein
MQKFPSLSCLHMYPERGVGMVGVEVVFFRLAVFEEL